MPRRGRIDYPGALHHVISRGIERKYIFKQDRDKDEFHKRLKENLAKSSMQCFAWCVMGNHFHLLLQSGTTRLAEFMRSLLTGYAVYYNRKHKRVGHLFQNRYKSTICDKDAYLLSLVRYIHLNPVKAHMIEYKDLRRYKWSGHREILEEREEGLIERQEILGYLASREKEAIGRYRDYVKEGLYEKEDFEGGGLFRSGEGKWGVRGRKNEEREMYDDRILGNGSFVENVLENFDEADQVSSKLRNLDEMIEKVSQYYNVNKKDILETREKSVRDARKVVVYLGNQYLEKSLVDMGRLLGIRDTAAGMAKKGGREIVESCRLMSKLGF